MMGMFVSISHDGYASVNLIWSSAVLLPSSKTETTESETCKELPPKACFSLDTATAGPVSACQPLPTISAHSNMMVQIRYEVKEMETPFLPD